MKKFLTLILALVLLVSSIPIQGFAYTCDSYSSCTANGAEIYEISENDAPIREEAVNSGKIYARAQKGQFVSVKRVFRTKRLTRWAELQTDTGKKLYVYTGNIKPHQHDFSELLESESGYLDICRCGLSKIAYAGQTYTCDLYCMADQAILGSFSEYEPTFASIALQILAGEIAPGISDVRDLIGDIVKGEPGWVIALDVVGLLPLVGALRYIDELWVFGKSAYKITKYSDEIAAAGRRADEINDILKKLDDIFHAAASKSDPSLLRKNMKEAFEQSGKSRYFDLNLKNDVAAHHIVAGSDKYAEDARKILSGVGIDVNDARNGVFLPTKPGISDASVHSGRHTAEYSKQVYDRLSDALLNTNVKRNATADEMMSAYRRSIEKELDSIAKDLLNGNLKLNKAS